MMKTTYIRLTASTVLLSLIATCGSPLYAGQRLQFNSIRQLGMGGVGIAQTHDATALYINPAGLAEAKSAFKLPLRVRADINAFTLSHSSDAQFLLDSKNSKTDKLHRIDNLELPYTVAAKTALEPGFSWVNPKWGVGVFAQGSVFAKISNPVVPEVNIQGYTDISPMIGYADTIEVAGAQMAIGGTFRYISRSRIMDPATGAFVINQQAADFIEDTKFNISQTTMTGIGADIGTLMPLGSGQFGMVISNIGSELKGTTPSGNAVTETLPMHLSLGYAQELDASGLPVIGGLLGSFDAEADVKFEHQDMYKNIYFGVEKKILNEAVTLRAGLHQGFPSVGLAVDAWILHMQYAYYTEEAGEKVGDDPQSYHAFEIGILF